MPGPVNAGTEPIASRAVFQRGELQHAQCRLPVGRNSKQIALNLPRRYIPEILPRPVSSIHSMRQPWERCLGPLADCSLVGQMRLLSPCGKEQALLAGVLVSGHPLTRLGHHKKKKKEHNSPRLETWPLMDARGRRIGCFLPKPIHPGCLARETPSGPRPGPFPELDSRAI